MVIETPRAEIEARAKVTQPRAAAAGRRADGAPGLPAVALRAPTRPTSRASTGDSANDLVGDLRRPERVDPGVQGVPLQRARGAPRGGDDRAAGRRRLDARRRPTRARRIRPSGPSAARRRPALPLRRREPGDLMPTEIAIHSATPTPQRMGFFTDTTTCIGCKACEVACKQWNDLPADGCASARAAPTTTRARCRRRRGGTCAS